MTASDIFQQEVALIKAERNCSHHDAWMLAKALSPNLYTAMENSASTGMANAVETVTDPVTAEITRGTFLRAFLPERTKQILGMKPENTDGFILQRLRTNSLKIGESDAQAAINGLIEAVQARGMATDDALEIVNRLAYPFFRAARISDPSWEPLSKRMENSRSRGARLANIEERR